MPNPFTHNRGCNPIISPLPYPPSHVINMINESIGVNTNIIARRLLFLLNSNPSSDSYAKVEEFAALSLIFERELNPKRAAAKLLSSSYLDSVDELSEVIVAATPASPNIKALTEHIKDQVRA